MIVEEALAARLEGFAGLSALVADRIYPLALPQEPTPPAVVFLKVSGPRDLTQSGASGLVNPRFQVDAWAATYSSAKAVAEQVRLALIGFSGTMGGASGVYVSGVNLDNERDLYEDETRLYRVSLDFTLWTREAVQ